jgi:hypothetical protein
MSHRKAKWDENREFPCYYNGEIRCWRSLGESNPVSALREPNNGSDNIRHRPLLSDLFNNFNDHNPALSANVHRLLFDRYSTYKCGKRY